MSKSTGNFIMLSDAIRGQRTMEMKIEKKGGKKKGNEEEDFETKVLQIGWTSDATRVALADGGDLLEDANFTCDVADNAVMRLFSETRFAEQIVNEETLNREIKGDVPDHSDALIEFQEKVFDAQMDQAIDLVDAAFSAMRFRDALKDGFFILSDCRDVYRKAILQLGGQFNYPLMRRYVETYAKLISPICPHYSENIYRNILGNNKGSVFDSGFPKAKLEQSQRQLYVKKIDYLINLEHKARTAMEKMIQRSKTLVKASEVVFSIGSEVPQWHSFVCDYLRNQAKSAESPSKPETLTGLSKAMGSDPQLKPFLKDAMKLAPGIYDAAQSEGESAYETICPFNEEELLEMYKPLMLKFLDLDDIQLKLVGPEVALPGKPVVSVKTIPKN